MYFIVEHSFYLSALVGRFYFEVIHDAVYQQDLLQLECVDKVQRGVLAITRLLL